MTYLYFNPRDRAWIEEHFDLTKYEVIALDYAPSGRAYITRRPIEDNVVAQIGMSVITDIARGVD